MSTKCIVLNEDGIASLNAVIEYCWADELEDYRECSDKDPNANSRSGHVFEHLVALSNLVDGSVKTPQEYVDEAGGGLVSLREWCDQCEALSINGVPCHEKGCPNEKKRRVDGEWVRFLKCRECGDDVQEGEMCDCQSYQAESEDTDTILGDEDADGDDENRKD